MNLLIFISIFTLVRKYLIQEVLKRNPLQTGMSFSKVCLGNSACFLGVFEKNTATAMFQNSAKYHELQLKERPGTPTLPPNCLAHSSSRHSFWDKIFFRFTSISLASKLIISGRIRFSSAHVVRTVGHIKVFIIFFVFTFAAFSVKFLQLFRFTIWRYFSHCLKIRIKIISVNVKM